MEKKVEYSVFSLVIASVDWIDYTMDASDSDSTGYGWLGLLLGRPPTPDDVSTWYFYFVFCLYYIMICILL